LCSFAQPRSKGDSLPKRAPQPSILASHNAGKDIDRVFVWPAPASGFRQWFCFDILRSCFSGSNIRAVPVRPDLWRSCTTERNAGCQKCARVLPGRKDKSDDSALMNIPPCNFAIRPTSASDIKYAVTDFPPD
jgi:hypothetical protein